MFHIWLCVEVDAVGYPNKHVAVGDSVVLGHAHTDTIASRVDHGLEVTGGCDPVVDGVLSGIGCTSEHGEVVTEAVGVAGIDSGRAFLWGVVPSVPPVGQAWAAFIKASLTGSSGTPLALRVWLMSRIISCRISKLSVRLVLSSSMDGAGQRWCRL